ncbi:CASP-like protein 5A1 isoform X3 [Lolium perenne]|uniref:CASP-like protein 5A1 isoform X3 n=1 Tax=Lolium perenne TaxID=4522 RepID=UPI0021F542E8|nr:CASP-like protein 5A3 [Lolium perenne]
MMPRLPFSHPLVHPDPAPVPVPVPAPAPPAPAPAAAPAPAPAAAPQAPAQGQGNAGPNAPPGVLMHGLHGGALVARLAQALLAAAAVAAMVSASDFASLTAFRYLVAAEALQCLWSLALSILYCYALLVGRSYRSPRAIAILCAGDWITGVLTFTAACASAGITTFVNDDVEACFENHCPSFMAATALAFLTWFTVAPCCVLNLGSVIHKLQRP